MRASMRCNSPGRRVAADRVVHPPTTAQRLEYVALRSAAFVLRPFGWRAASAVGAGVGAFVYRVLRLRADRVERAIRACFPEFPEPRVRAVAAASYRSIGRVMFESIYLSRATPAEVLGAFSGVEGRDVLEAAYAQGKGVILAAGHIGNWELSGAWLGASGLPVDGITMHMANPLADRFFARTRERLGMRVIFDDEAVRAVPRSLRENRAIGFVSDQSAKGLASTIVPFFGRPARTPRGAAVFAMRGDVPIVFISAIRQPDGRYLERFEAVPTVRAGDRDADIDATVLRYTQVLEQLVRAHPEQYFWQHRRWKGQPSDTPAHLREP